MKTFEKFNNSAFGCWINSTTGRLFRLFAGIIFLTLGLFFYPSVWAIASLVWSIFPLSAGIFNICWVSMVLGGPVSSAKIIQLRNKKQDS